MKTETLLVVGLLAVGGFLVYRELSAKPYGQGGVGSGASNGDTSNGGVGSNTGRAAGSGSYFDRGMGAIDKGQVVVSAGKGILDELNIHF